MKIKIVAVGKVRDEALGVLEGSFAERIQRYAELQQVIVKDASQTAEKRVDLTQEREARNIRAKLAPGDLVVACAPKGKQMTSKEFARFLQEHADRGTRSLAFVIGGPLGLSAQMLEASSFRLSFSKMTFPHELAKVILLEQIYRAFTILRGEKYHK